MKFRKVTDYETRFRTTSGIGILREEVWVDTEGEVVRYNLALIFPQQVAMDRGRVLGYDNAHGLHERHFRGKMSEVEYQSYDATARRFYREADAIRRMTNEDEDLA
jgi:hypothetical protein